MKTLVNFVANATQAIATIRVQNRDKVNYVATILVYGTFGGGTLALFLSPDNGTTLIPLTGSPGGSAASFNANGMLQLNCGFPVANTDTLKLYATLSGATSPNLNVVNYDNNG